MKIKKINLKNIRSYENEEIIFKEGSTILSGDIGSGKTSVLLAVEFALFGLQPGQKGAALLRNGRDEGEVILEIDIEGKIIIIKRGLKKTKSVNQTEVSVSIDGEEKEMSIKESKNLILSLLNYPREFASKTNILYKFTVYTPQEEMKQIILESPEARLNTLRHIFGIDKYKRIEENSSVFSAKLRENIREMEGTLKNLDETNKRLDGKKSNIQILNANLLLEKNEFEIKKKERKEKEKEKDEAELKIKEKEKYEQQAEKMLVMIMGKKEMLSSMKREKDLLLKQIEEASGIKEDLNTLPLIEKEKEEKELLKEDMSKQYLQLMSQLNSLTQKITENDKLKDQISSLRFCPTCLQSVPDSYKENVLSKFDEEVIKSRKTFAVTNKTKNDLVFEMDETKNKIKELEKKIAELKLIKIKLESIKEKETRVKDIEKNEAAIDKDFELLESQIQILKETASEMKRYESIYEFKKKELETAFKKEKETEIKIASIEKEIELTSKEIAELEKDIETMLLLKDKMSYIKDLEDWLEGDFLSLIRFTEKSIMHKLREQFSKLFNEWFNILVPENFTVSLDEEFTPVIEHKDYQLDYGFLSGGERTAIALAYRLSLNQTINSIMSSMKTRDLIILDEPTEGFSEQQLDKMRDVLHQLKVKQMIIVSHEAKIEAFVQNIIKFKKEAGITRLV